MFFISTPLFFAIIGAILFWLSTLSILLYRTTSHYNKLSKGVTKQNLSSILETILSELTLSQKELVKLRAQCDKIEQEGLFHTQKIGLLRFNPFSDTGGDQSFILAILNGHDDGILLSSLHGRTGTRWFAKTVKGGKGLEHELSNEEKSVIKSARPLTSER